jgi:hypothetical protein
VKVGALRLNATSASSTVNSVGFKNPDGSIAVIVYNANAAATTVRLVNGTNAFDYSIPAASAVTFNWSTGPPVAVTGVSVSPTSATVAVNNSTQLNATFAPANASNTSVTWTSSNPAVASVSSSGLVSGIAAGTTTITVKTVDGNKIATSAITVTVIAITGVTVSPTTPSIFAGQTQQLTASVLPSAATNKTVSWSSSNAGVATVNSSGLVFTQVEATARVASESEASEEMLVYPNPAGNVVKIVSKYLENGTVEFTGMTGLVMMKVPNNTPSTEKTIDITPLKQGVYIIKVANEDGFETKKLVKE